MILAFDPGASGGHCRLDGRSTVLSVGGIPRIGTQWDFTRMLELFRGAEVVAIEKVNCGAVLSRKSAFTFAEGYGILQGMTASTGLRVEMVPPKVWQKEMLSGVTGGDTKQRARISAMRLWPEMEDAIRKLGDGPIDAMLIAEYVRRARR